MTATGRLRAALGLAFAGLLVQLIWSRSLSVLALAVGAAALGASAVLLWRAARSDGPATRTLVPAGLGLGILLISLTAAATTTIRLQSAARNWAAVETSRTQGLEALLERRLEGSMRRVVAAAEHAASSSSPGGIPSFGDLAAVLKRTGVDAVAVLDEAGQPLAWAGDHRGAIPASVHQAAEGLIYPGGTLFGYLYAVVPLGGGRRAMSAVLLQAGHPLTGSTGSLAERFEARTGARPEFRAPRTVDGETSAGRGAVVSVQFPELSQADWRGEVSTTGRRAVFGLVILALVLLSMSWLRTLPDRGGLMGIVPIAALSATLMAAPLGRTLGLRELFSPAMFVLPFAGDFVIEGLMVLLLPLAALAATLRPGRFRKVDFWMQLAISSALAAGGFAVLTGLLTASAGPPMLTGGGELWYALQPTAVVLLTVVAALLMPRRDEAEDERQLLGWGAAGIVVSIALSLLLVSRWHPGGPLPTPMLLLWALPFALVARGLAGYVGRGDRLIRWLAAGWLASTAVLPHLWVAGQEARMAEAEQEVAYLGVRGDPYLSYLLVQLTEELDRAAAAGATEVDLLYQAWVQSGLSSEPYPLDLSLWDSAGVRTAYLPLGARLSSEARVREELERAAERALADNVILNEPAASAGVSRILAVPMASREAVTVAVAPGVSLRPSSALATFLEGDPHQDARVELMPATATMPLTQDRVQWQRTEEGWQAETTLKEGRDVYHAHVQLRLPPSGVRLARGVLLVALNMIVLTLLWWLGRLARGDAPVPPGGWLGWLAGFRARLIVAMFAFFLLPTAVFGWAAYRALAEEVTRAARQVAERAVTQAAGLLPSDPLSEVADRTGEDLLYFRRGVLAAASVPEAAELGLYGAWMPPEQYRPIRDGEAIGATETGEVAGRQYLVAYRRLPSSRYEAVAAPIWLAARDVAVRQREFAHVVLFGALMGAVLSLGLSVLVGRALTRPIGELRRAAAAVGRGRLRVRLPQQRPDEFGELFASFNQMTRRLRQARAQELRTARILAWGEMARQVAHEIKNPLTPIKLSVQHIRRAYRDGTADFDPILDSNTEQILVEIERLTEIARAFSRYGAPEDEAGPLESVDVAAITRDLMTLYSAPDRSVSYRMRRECGDCRGLARSSELREVVVNLLENARAAVGESGTVEVRVTSNEEEIEMEVADDGEGISPEQLPRIFDPHFSTRSSGTGLGLAIVRRLVESWGGTVSAESEVGEGTVVRLTIPRETAPAPEGADAVEEDADALDR